MRSVVAWCPPGLRLVVGLLLIGHVVLVGPGRRHIRPVLASGGVDLGAAHKRLVLGSLVGAPASLESVFLLLDAKSLSFGCRTVRSLCTVLCGHLLVLLLLELVVNRSQIIVLLIAHILPQLLDLLVFHLKFGLQDPNLLFETQNLLRVLPVVLDILDTLRLELRPLGFETVDDLLHFLVVPHRQIGLLLDQVRIHLANVDHNRVRTCIRVKEVLLHF